MLEQYYYCEGCAGHIHTCIGGVAHVVILSLGVVQSPFCVVSQRCGGVILCYGDLSRCIHALFDELH